PLPISTLRPPPHPTPFPYTTLFRSHKIELQPLTGFPGRVVPYARREELAAALQEVVAGKTVAMEVSPRDGVPYLDRVPHGIVELDRKEHTSELQSLRHLVCRLLLEK